MLALITVVFTWQQTIRQNELEDQRAEAQRDLAEQRAQDEALQAYLDQMSQLMLERNLLKAEPGNPVYTLARARTSTIIASLDAENNGDVARFLTESGLAYPRDAESGSGAGLLFGIELENAALSEVILSNVDLSNAYLRHADLSDADLSGADLSRAYLVEANLSGAVLSGADLTYATLDDADLREADLSGADLEGANVTEEQLSECKSLKGATMPSGQKYEDWLKSRGQDGETSSSS